MIDTVDVRDFSISKWYEKFEDVTLKTILIDLPSELVERFKLDEDIDLKNELYKKFVEDIKNALNIFNKKAFVKNNWHAPVDARMFSFGNTLQVSNIDDIILYFTTSSLIQQDFATVRGANFCIALRKWLNIHPAAEFRCIVINSTLRGITPRDWPTYYSHFKEEGPNIIEELNNFFLENIKLRFPRKHYTFDVVYSFPDKPYLLDFGPLDAKANLQAFTWEEIHPLISRDGEEEIPPVFRFLETDYGIMTRTAALNRFAQLQP